ncbi:Smr/MutS family protein [Thermaurantiacus sp.]
MIRRLTPEEEALWRQATASVRRARGAGGEASQAPAKAPAVALPPPPTTAPEAPGVGKHPARPASSHPTETLDARWDRRLRARATRPDRVIDLHGLTRAAARGHLERAIHAAAARGERLLLVVTGKGSAPGPAPADLMGDRPSRGAIRAELPRWLAEPALSARIAAVREAGAAHGGRGAVWLVLRRIRQAR